MCIESKLKLHMCYSDLKSLKIKNWCENFINVPFFHKISSKYYK